VCAFAERTRLDLRRDALEDQPREEFGRRIPPLERRIVVEIAVVELREHDAQSLERRADVDDEPVVIELHALELDIDDVSRAVQVLRGTEDLSFETVRDHEVIADRDAVHR
jgi:hypothetical protein